eukprot:gene36423-44183_t
MHESYKKDVLRQELNIQLERVKQRLAGEMEEVKYYSSIILQAWWRMIYYGRIGRRIMKKRRQRQRRAYALRKEQQALRESWAYKYAAFWGRAPELTSDTREEKVLGKVAWYRKKIAKMYIEENKEDWGHYRISRTKPRKGTFKTGFQVGSLDELHAQAMKGGYRLPGYVILRNYDRIVETTCDLTNFLTPGEIVRVRSRLFVVVSVEAGSSEGFANTLGSNGVAFYDGGGKVKLHRCWRHSKSDLGEQDMKDEEEKEKDEEKDDKDRDDGGDDDRDDEDDDNTPSVKKKAPKKKKNTMFATLTNPATSAQDPPLLEVMYRMPTYKNEPYKRWTSMRLQAYGVVFHNPITQIGLYISKAIYLRMTRFAVYMFTQNKAQKQLIEAAEWKKRAFLYAQQAKYLSSFFSNNDALVHLGSVSQEEAKRRVADRKRAYTMRASQRRRQENSDDSGSDDEDDASEDSRDGAQGDENTGKRQRKRRKQRKNQEGIDSPGDTIDDPISDSPRSKPTTPSRRFSTLSRRSMTRILAESGEQAAADGNASGAASRGTSPLTSLTLPFSLSMKSSRGGSRDNKNAEENEHLVTSRKSRRSKKKST